MNYKETLYFIAKCMTISLEDKNRQEIEKHLKLETIDWDAVVKLSTAHFVLPALYCNLKRVDFLQYLPHDLVSYMEHITDVNRERNKQIITQAIELNSLLLANNITPIFLKGTGNLLAGIYEDIGERMVGDIDFIFSKEDYPKAITVLREFGYTEVIKYKYYFPDDKHFRRLQKEKNIAVIEIHSEFLNIKKYTNEFNYMFVVRDFQLINGFRVLSYANKLNLSIIAHQINDSGFYYKTIALRNAYDVFLLSKKTNTKDAVNSLDKLSHPLNCFLAKCYEVFDKVDSLVYTNRISKVDSYLRVFHKQFINITATKRKHRLINFFIILKARLTTIYKCLVYKEYRIWLFYSLGSLAFYKRRLGIKK